MNTTRRLPAALFAAFVAGLATLPVLGEAAPPAPERPVLLTTWNVENLFDETDDPERADTVRTAAEVEQKLANLAAVLRSIDDGRPPAILAVQEVETAELLHRLGRRVHGKTPFEVRHAQSGDRRGMGVGLLTTWAVRSSRVVDDGEPGSRPILVARLAPPGREAPDLDLIVLHWKSKRQARGEGPLDDERRRLRQAGVTRGLVEAIRKERPGARIAVAGDFNDGCGAHSLGRLGASSDLDGVRASPTESLYDTAWRLSPSRRGTVHWSFNAPPTWAAWATFDHVLLSASLLGDGPLSIDLGAGPTKRGVDIRAFTGRPAKFRAPKGGFGDRDVSKADLSLGVSDHFPVSVWLRLRRE